MTQRLKPASVFTSVLFILALSAPIFSQRKNDINSVPFSPAFYRVGERLTYNVSFSNFLSAAHVELRVIARGTFFGREAIQLRAHVETTGVINAALFSINSDYISYIDPATGLPFRTQQIDREGVRVSERFMDLNAPGSPPVHDLVSALYRLRTVPLGEGRAYSLVVRGENQIEYQVEVKGDDRETVKNNIGSYNASVMEVRVKNDSYANSLDLRISIADDEHKTPVRVLAKQKVGMISADLAGVELLRPPAVAQAPAANNPVTPRPSTPNTAPAPSTGLEGLPFFVGEQLTYQLFLGNVPEVAATATFQVRARSRYFENDGLLLTLQAQTTNAIQKLFFANDRINTYVNPRTLLPYRTEMDLTEGRRRLLQNLTINQDHGLATSEQGQRIEIPVGTHDYLSFFYTLRTLPLTPPPRRNAVSLLVENKPKTLVISSIKREVIRLANQDIPAIQLTLTTDDPQPDKYTFRAWISDDRRRLPLRMTVTSPLGPVRADLVILPLAAQ